MLRVPFQILTLLATLALLVQPRTGLAGPPPGESDGTDTSPEPTGEPDPGPAPLRTRILGLTEGESAGSELSRLQQSALAHLEAARSFEARIKTLRARALRAPQETPQIRAQLDRPDPPPELPDPTQTSSAELQQLILEVAAASKDAQARLEKFRQELRREQERADEGRDRLAEVEALQTDLELELNTPQRDEDDDLSRARRWVSEAHALAVAAELKMLREELETRPARVPLMEAQRDRALRDVRYAERRRTLLEGLLNQTRLTGARAALADANARLEAVSDHPTIQRLARDNVSLAESLVAAVEELEDATTRAAVIRDRVHWLEDNTSTTREIIRLSGTGQAIGRVLQEQRETLPSDRAFRRALGERKSQYAEVGLRRLRHSHAAREIRDMRAAVERELATLSPEEVREHRDAIRGLLEARAPVLRELDATDEELVRTLARINTNLRWAADTVEKYEAYLGKHLLWLRTSDPTTWSDFSRLSGDLARLFRPEPWRVALSGFAVLSWHQLLALFTIGVALVLFGLRRRLVAGLEATLASPAHGTMAGTWQALVWTVLISSPLPLVLLAMAWEVHLAGTGETFAEGVERACVFGGVHAFAIVFLRTICLPKGLGVGHFRWHRESAEAARRAYGHFGAAFIPLAMLTVVEASFDRASVGGIAGRLAFAAAMLAYSALLFRLLHPRRGAIAPGLERTPSGLLTRTAPLWFWATVVFPLAPAVGAFRGYVEISGTMVRILDDTVWLVTGLVVVRAIVVRALRLAQLELLRDARREAADSNAENASSDSPEDLAAVALSDESRRFVNLLVVLLAGLGMFWIWSNLLPAFAALDDVVLWRSATPGNTPDKVTTLADVVVALLIGIGTVVVAQRAPTLLHMVLLRRLGIGVGSRYAIVTLSIYTLVGIGFAIALARIGVGWSQIQWLVAALGVGIGFGLQEIVANFISGVIILLERPIRVGDVITVGDTAGVVARIQLRATTIRDWDEKELLVPNKEFVTGRLLNWTLSDKTQRIVIEVGVAYDTDPEQAMALLIEAAREHPEVVDSPAPFVTFESFGDNALTLMLRAYVADVEWRLRTMTELRVSVFKKLGDAGIEIAFPQRSVHLDTRTPLEVRMQSSPERPVGNPSGPGK